MERPLEVKRSEKSAGADVAYPGIPADLFGETYAVTGRLSGPPRRGGGLDLPSDSYVELLR